MSIQNTNLPNNPNIEVIKAKETGLFTNYIFKAIPLAFDESMSYYETLCGLLSYLKDTVIPTVNNNANAVSELQNLYVELKTYVDDYFTNLDVQEEINNKLDKMTLDGTLTNLIKAYVDPIYQTYETSINDKIILMNNNIQSINNKVDSATNGSPKGVYATLNDLITNNPNHDYIYLVTATGKWYYYDTTLSSWTAGGDYQSSGIAKKSITILNLDDSLQSNFNINYSKPITKESYSSGYYYVNNGNVAQGSDNAWKCFTESLDVNKIYTYSGINNAIICCLIITDNNGNIIYNSNPTKASGIHYVSDTVLINDNGCTAYFSFKEDKFHTADTTMFRVLNNVYNNFKIKTQETSIRTIANSYIAYANTISSDRVRITTANDYTTDIYQMCKGVTYKITYKGYSDARGYCITDLSTKLIDIPNDASSGTITFTAVQNGYIYLCNKSTNVTGTIEIIYKAIDVNIESTSKSILNNKKIAYEGDSIAESRTGAMANNGGGYAKIIANLTNGTYINHAVGGGRLSSTIGITPAKHSVVDNIAQLPSDADLYCIEGGVNDYFSGVPLGTFDPIDYTSSLDITTISGALEQIFRYLISTYVGKPIIFVIIHKISNPFVIHGGYDFPTLRQRLIDICNKYSIPYYDAYNNSGLNGMITQQADAYLNANASGTTDGLHPNANGYKKYYVPQLISLMENVIEKNI